MTKLSPAAQQVFWEFNRAASGKPDDWHYLPAIAAALRAAADQVVPEEPLYGGDQRWMFERDARQASRKKLRAIAAELEQVASINTTEVS
jgi:hypothetical protein